MPSSTPFSFFSPFRQSLISSSSSSSSTSCISCWRRLLLVQPRFQSSTRALPIRTVSWQRHRTHRIFSGKQGCRQTMACLDPTPDARDDDERHPTVWPSRSSLSPSSPQAAPLWWQNPQLLRRILLHSSSRVGDQPLGRRHCSCSLNSCAMPRHDTAILALPTSLRRQSAVASSRRDARWFCDTGVVTIVFVPTPTTIARFATIVGFSTPTTVALLMQFRGWKMCTLFGLYFGDFVGYFVTIC